MGKKQKIDPEFLKILSHQLKSPIHAIQSLLGTVTEGYAGEVDKKVLTFIEKALKRSKEVQDVVSDLLDYEFYSENPAEKIEEYDFISLLKGLIEQYKPLSAEKNVQLTSDIPEKLMLSLGGSKTGMTHAIRNLLENGIKYTPSPGTLRVRLAVKLAEKTCTLEVTDSGYGIPQCDWENIFKPFYRAIKTKSVISGTGLGLAIVKKVIENHGGVIKVKSRVNEGTSFLITLPVLNMNELSGDAGGREKVVIVGGVTAGPKVAARLRRLDANLDITVIEQQKFLSYSGCGLPSLISGEVTSPVELMSTSDGAARDVNFFESIQDVHVLNRTRVEGIDRTEKVVSYVDLVSGEKGTAKYDYLVLATGGEAIVPDIPGIQLPGIYTLRSLEDAQLIKKEMSEMKARDVHILGGGLIGAAVAEALIEAGARITIIEQKGYILLNQLDSDISNLIQAGMNKKGIKVVTGATIDKISKTGNQLTIESRSGVFLTDFIILSAGVKPNTALASKAGLKIGKSGGIKVDASLKTTDPAIYAIGDCAESINLITGKHEYWPLGSISTKMGRIAADNICNRQEDFAGSIGTAYLKIFEINVARTGLTSRSALKNGFDPVSVVVSGEDRAHYSKGAEYITLKVIADRESRQILGAQGFGRGDVVSRIEIFAFAISQAMTLPDFFKVDLGYAPAYNKPIDVSQTACLTLCNKLDGMVKTISYFDFKKEMDSYEIIDLSPPDEHTAGSIPGSLNIPLERIRNEDLPFKTSSRVLLYSKTSAGAYTAYRYLVTQGFTNLYVLEGGYILWKMIH